MRTGTTIIALFAALALFGAACSSSDDPEPADRPDATEDASADEDRDDRDDADDRDDDADDRDDADDPDSDDPDTDNTVAAGDPDDFCDVLIADENIDLGTAEGRERAEEVLAMAPQELRGPFELFFEMAEQMEAMDENDPDLLAEMFALVMDPEVIAATEEVEAWGVEECGFEPGFLSGEDEFDLSDLDDLEFDLDLDDLEPLEDSRLPE